ncbi:MAG TPA: ornithine carbamoyltransferase [Dehalococcoidia bacterium]|nr:ornithine carbamoyltransferase [Dehalococcoidia bacterium]
MKGKDFLSISDIADEDITSFIAEAVALKAQGSSTILKGKTLGLLFEKPSLRTRISFEVGMRRLGGEVIYLSPAEVGLGQRESAPDVARVLGRYFDAITARTFVHRTVEELAKYSGVPVINALSDLEHPCQALADLLTIYEKKGGLKGVTLAYIGDGNNIANSLLLLTALAGMNFKIASPQGYEVGEDILNTAREYAARRGSTITCTQSPREAVNEADVVYTDVWTSMGQEAESQQRLTAFSGYQVDASLLSMARKDAIFMHDLPAHRGEEVTDDVMDGPQSVVFDQAENRMHAQNALLVKVLAAR